MKNDFFAPSLETIQPDRLKVLQLSKLRDSVAFAVRNSPYYRDKIGLSSKSADLASLADFAHNIPLTTKDDLRSAGRYDFLAVPKHEIVEIHFSSGTSGSPSYSFLTKDDIALGSEYLARTWYMQGVREDSTFAMLASYGLFSAGLLNHYAIQHIGAFVIPLGGAIPLKSVELIRNFEANIAAAVASYYPYLISIAAKQKINLRDLGLRHLVAGGEPFTEQERTYINNSFNASLLDQYGLCEINTGIAGECGNKDGLHLLADYVYPEIVSVDSGKALPDGEDGELVLTTFHKRAAPLLRYRTGDITSITWKPCVCGRTMPRIARIKKRTTDTLFYKGVGIEKDYVSSVLLEMKDVLNPYLWQIEVNRIDGSESMLLHVDMYGNKSISLQRITEKLINAKLGLKTKVVNFSDEELANLGSSKLKHFIDHRNIS